MTTLPQATGPQLVALLERVLPPAGDGDPPLVLVHAEPGEPPVLDAVGGRKVTVRSSRSALEIRALTREPRDGPLVVLTDLPRTALGDDLLARATGRRVQELDRWANVCQLFGARQPAPDLVRRPYLADALVEARPLTGYPQVASRVLDLDTATAALVRAYLGVSDDVASLNGFMEWASRPASAGRLTESRGDLLEDLRAALRDRFGPGVDAVLAAATSGWSPDLVPLGLAAGVVHHPDMGDGATAAARLDERLHRPGLPAEAYRAWAAAATEAVDAAGEPGGALAWLTRAEALLADLDALGGAHLSDVLPTGFDQRVGLAARALARWRAARDDAGAAAAAGTAIRRAGSHRGSKRAPDRVQRLWMAARLVRRGSPSLTGLTDLVSAAAAYARDGAWLDLARTVVSRGDPDPDLAALCADLTAEADTARMADGLRFARMAATAADTLPAGLPGVEDVLDTVVGPLAAERPVLLVVLDGLSWPTFVELIETLEASGWTRLRRPDDTGEPVAVAALPTVTEVSRASLLAGMLRRGDDASERRAFAAHAGLAGASPRDAPPVLFHKTHLRAGGLDTIPGSLLDEVADSRRRVVGVVLNNIDERLKDVIQPLAGWTLAELSPLHPVLEAARRAGRVVVITGDHGHVLDRDAELRAGVGGGERWRPADPPPGEGEIALAGRRVVADGDTIVVPWREQVHYGTRRNGYHGGITPQELLVPVVVLSTDDLDGWVPAAIRKPAWWHPFSTVGALTAPAEQATPSAVPPRIRPPGAAEAPTLFDIASALPEVTATAGSTATPAGEPRQATAAAWVDALLASEPFAAQRRNPRVRLGEDELRRLLAVLDGAGTTRVPERRLADEAGLPAARIGRYVAQLQDLLNLDGYPVVTVAEGGVGFDRALLERQFGL